MLLFFYALFRIIICRIINLLYLCGVDITNELKKIDMKSELGKKLDDLIKRSGIVELIKEDAIIYNEFFDKMDEAWYNDQMNLWDELDKEQTKVKEKINNKIKVFFPINIEPNFLNNVRSSAIDLALN